MVSYPKDENKHEKEFINRTFKIIEQYKSKKNDFKNNYYDVTLLLNCLLALVVLPRESQINNLSTDCEIPECIKHTLQSVKVVLPCKSKINKLSPNCEIQECIKHMPYSAKDEADDEIKVTFREYIIGLRNGIVHFGQEKSLKFIDDNGTISAITLAGKTTINNQKHALTFQFNLSDKNDLERVIEKIHEYVYSATDCPTMEKPRSH